MTDNEICIVEVYYYEVTGKLLKCEDCPFECEKEQVIDMEIYAIIINSCEDFDYDFDNSTEHIELHATKEKAVEAYVKVVKEEIKNPLWERENYLNNADNKKIFDKEIEGFISGEKREIYTYFLCPGGREDCTITLKVMPVIEQPK